jgi:hypothetical protein
MQVIVLILSAIFIVGFLIALIFIQLPLIYYLEDKWNKIKNRETKIIFLLCVLVGLGCYPFVTGSLFQGSTGGGSNPSAGVAGTSGGRTASSCASLNKNTKSGTTQKENLKQEQSVRSVYVYDWVKIARGYLSGVKFKAALLRKLQRLTKKQLQKLSEREWRTLRDKLAKDPSLH